MKGHRAARVTEAASILLTPSTLSAAITKPPRCCRGRILFGSVIDRQDIEADLFERYCEEDLHLVLPVIAPERPWVFDRYEVGHRRHGVLVWYQATASGWHRRTSMRGWCRVPLVVQASGAHLVN